MTRNTARKPRNTRGTLPAFAPVPRHNHRHDGWTPERQRAFIEALADLGSVAAACRTVGKSEVGAYLLRRHPEAHEFRQAWEAALALGVQRIEDVAMDRALNGVEVPVYAYGNIIGTRVVYNDRLLMFMLRNRAPKRFAADNAKGMNALDKAKLKRLERQWRKDWEAQQAANGPGPAEVRATIERKVEALRRRVIANTSPRALDLKIAHIAQGRADSAAGWRAGEPYAPYADKAAALLPGFIDEVRAEFPPQEEPEDAAWDDADDDHDKRATDASEAATSAAGEPPALPGPRIITLKGGWE